MKHRVCNQRARVESVLLLGLTIMASWTLCPGCADNHVDREAQLIAQVDSLGTVIKSTRGLRDDFEQGAKPVIVNEHQIKELQRKGLSDPLVDLAKDLRSHPELLPKDLVGELGGKYGFYDPEGVHLLTTKWVLADFDDGHRVGHMLLEFSVRGSGTVDWKAIAWAVDE